MTDCEILVVHAYPAPGWVSGKSEFRNVRIRCTQVGRTAEEYSTQMVAGPEGPAYMILRALCRRVLQGAPPDLQYSGGWAGGIPKSEIRLRPSGWAL